VENHATLLEIQRFRDEGGGQACSKMDRPLSAEDESEIRRQLAELRLEHRDLDTAIAVMSSAANADPMGLQRLKKRKLALKDRITKLEDKLLPDIIA
jgi:hypothetical protein